MESTRRVLLVDDDVDHLIEAEAELEARGHLVLATTRAEFAALLARTFQPAVMVLSADLLADHAHEILDELRDDARTAHLPVVLMSNRLEECIVAGLAAGAVAAIRRPVDREGLDLIDQAAALGRREGRLRSRGEPLLARLLLLARANALTGTLHVRSSTCSGQATFEAGALLAASFAEFRLEEALVAMLSARLKEVAFEPDREIEPVDVFEVLSEQRDPPWDLAA